MRSSSRRTSFSLQDVFPRLASALCLPSLRHGADGLLVLSPAVFPRDHIAAPTLVDAGVRVFSIVAISAASFYAAPREASRLARRTHRGGARSFDGLGQLLDTVRRCDQSSHQSDQGPRPVLRQSSEHRPPIPLNAEPIRRIRTESPGFHLPSAPDRRTDGRGPRSLPCLLQPSPRPQNRTDSLLLGLSSALHGPASPLSPLLSSVGPPRFEGPLGQIGSACARPSSTFAECHGAGVHARGPTYLVGATL